ncbi:uncharacterized protein LOC135834663 isoform X3 [Planococcus citri]|uniref:uncharacterized protein LOC135834663 isoform X3 n=1 Tax=Planococcus citri TaxID=170843 RepID=UPI0031F8012A
MYLANGSVDFIMDCFDLRQYRTDMVLKGNSIRKIFLHTVMKIRAYYFFLWSTVGVITSLYGLFGVQKNIPRYLTYSYYYFLYYVAFVFLCAIVVLANPNWHRNYIMADGYLAYGSGSELTLIVFIMYVFAGAILSYFAIIVRSCRDTMEKNQANNQFNAMPDPATSGYNVA